MEGVKDYLEENIREAEGGDAAGGAPRHPRAAAGREGTFIHASAPSVMKSDSEMCQGRHPRSDRLGDWIRQGTTAGRVGMLTVEKTNVR